MEKLQSLFNLIVFAQFAFVLLQMCTTAFDLVLNFTLARFFGDLNLMVFSTSEVIMYCYFGDSLSEKANGIADKVYNNQWIDYSPEFRRYLILAIRRSQNPALIRGAQMVSCSMACFKSVSHPTICESRNIFQEIRFAAPKSGWQCFHGPQVSHVKASYHLLFSWCQFLNKCLNVLSFQNLQIIRPNCEPLIA